MNKRTTYFALAMIAAILLCGCKWKLSVRAEAVVFLEPSAVVEDDEDDDKDSKHQDEGDNQVSTIFYGSIYSVEDVHTATPVVGALIKIAGSDSPTSYTYSNDIGEFYLAVPIIPNRSNDYISFAIEVQAKDAKGFPIAEICKESDYYQLLHIEDSTTHTVASALYLNYDWDIVGKKIKCEFPVYINE